MNMKKYILLIGFVMANVDCSAGEDNLPGVHIPGTVIAGLLAAAQNYVPGVMALLAAMKGQSSQPTADQAAPAGGGAAAENRQPSVNNLSKTASSVKDFFQSELRGLVDLGGKKDKAIEELFAYADRKGLTSEQIAKFVKWELVDSFRDRNPQLRVRHDQFIFKQQLLIAQVDEMLRKIDNGESLSGADLETFRSLLVNFGQASGELKKEDEAILLEAERLFGKINQQGQVIQAQESDLRILSTKLDDYGREINSRYNQLEEHYQTKVATLSDAHVLELAAKDGEHSVAMGQATTSQAADIARLTSAKEASDRQNNERVANLENQLTNKKYLTWSQGLLVFAGSLIAGVLFSEFKIPVVQAVVNKFNQCGTAAGAVYSVVKSLASKLPGVGRLSAIAVPV